MFQAILETEWIPALLLAMNLATIICLPLWAGQP
jgi:hypothetical protein